jgi:hypothetical protein
MPRVTIDRGVIDLVKRLVALSDNLQALSAEAMALAVIIGREDAKRMLGQFMTAKRDNGSAVKPTP